MYDYSLHILFPEILLIAFCIKIVLVLAIIHDFVPYHFYTFVAPLISGIVCWLAFIAGYLLWVYFAINNGCR